MKKVLISLLALVIAGTASAAARLIVSDQDFNGDIDRVYSVQITADRVDVGRPGAFYIVGSLYGGRRYVYLGATEGWRVYQGGMGQATEMFSAIPAGGRVYNPLTGAVGGRAREKDICARLGNGQTIHLYAGIGALEPDKEEMVQTWHKEKNPLIDPDHIRNVYIQTDLVRNKKYWYLGSISCERFENG
jgi:hypothetical protein